MAIQKYKYHSYLTLARNIAIATIFIIGYNMYVWGLSYLSFIFIAVFTTYTITINKGNFLLSIIGMTASILFSISHLANTNNILTITVLIVVNCGFISGVIGCYKVYKNKTVQTNI